MQFIRNAYVYYSYNVTIRYYPNWDSSKDTWDDLPDTGNLPTPLQVIVNEHRGSSEGNTVQLEKYYYAKHDDNSFGIIRWEMWRPKPEVCGSENCCTTKECDNTLALKAYNTMNILRHYDEDEDPNEYYNPSFYADPKLEIYPGEPTNGALPRGRFQLPGEGMTADGQQLNAGDWMQITEILTDGDWMISKYVPPSQCPNGYQYLGSFAPPNYADHKTVEHGFSWAVLCGTNKNVLLATTCPKNYESRGWFDAPTPQRSAYDYQGNAVGGQKLYYCVHYNEFHYPKLSETKDLVGDVNKDGIIDLLDLTILIASFGTTNVNSDLNNNGKVDIFDIVLLAKKLM